MGPGQREVSWGYDPGVPFSVALAYGGPDGLKNLVRAAHEAGIAVILDVVYNHFGPPLGGRDLLLRDAVAWRWPPSGQRPGSRPDYGRPEVRQFIRDNALAWLQDYRADGLRFDATAYIRTIDGSGSPDQAIPDGSLLLQQVNGDIDLAQPWKLTIAEDLRDDASITLPVASGGSGFDSQWDIDFLWAVRQTVELTVDTQRDMNLIAAQVQRRFGAAASTRVIFTDPRRRRQRPHAPAGRDRPLTNRQLVVEEALHARRRAGLHRPRDPDDLPGPGVP